MQKKDYYEVLSDPERRKAYDELNDMKSNEETYSTSYQNTSNTVNPDKKIEKKKKREYFFGLL